MGPPLSTKANEKCHTVHKSIPSEMFSTKCAQVDKQSDLKISEKELLYRQSNDNHLC